jgi:hypothetical protein
MCKCQVLRLDNFGFPKQTTTFPFSYTHTQSVQLCNPSSRPIHHGRHGRCISVVPRGRQAPPLSLSVALSLFEAAQAPPLSLWLRQAAQAPPLSLRLSRPCPLSLLSRRLADAAQAPPAPLAPLPLSLRLRLAAAAQAPLSPPAPLRLSLSLRLAEDAQATPLSPPAPLSPLSLSLSPLSLPPPVWRQPR